MNNFNNNAGYYNNNFSQPAYNNNQHNTGNLQGQGFAPNCSYGNPANSQVNYNYYNPPVTMNPNVSNNQQAYNHQAYNQQRYYNNPANNCVGNVMPNVVYNPEQLKKEMKEAEEVKDIKRSANRSAGGLLIFSGITEILGIVLISLISLTGAYDLYNSDYINGIEPVTMYIVNAIVCLVGFGVGAIIITKLNKLRLDDVIKIKKVNAIDTVKFTIASMGFVYVFNLLLMLMNVNLNLFGFENETSDYGEINGLWGNIIYFIAVAIVPPIIEEFIFRGAILGSLRKHGDALAIIVSAVLFGFMHGNFIQTPVTFLTGLILGYLTVKTNSIIPAMILHFVNNAWAVLYEILEKLINNENIILIIDSAVVLFLLGVGLICTVSLVKKHKNDLFTFEKPDTELTMSKRLRYCFTTPCMIIFTIYTVIMCFYSVAVQ